MTFRVVPTPLFAKQVKTLAKKYRSLGTDLMELEKRLSKDPQTGSSLGNSVYKVRLAIKSRGKGKSGAHG